jgi:NTP pyrophosphatase (non-canonical NTP hydrolase)
MLNKQQQEFISALADDNGHIRPQDVIDAARPEESPIHRMFPWDVGEAAHRHWLDVACRLIRFVKLEIRVDRSIVAVPGYIIDPQRDLRVKRYLDVRLAREDAETSRLALLEELERIAQAIRRAQKVAMALGLQDELAQLLQDVSQLQTKAERRRAERAARQTKRAPRGRKRGGRREGGEARV